jgi:hypothetical protein
MSTKRRRVKQSDVEFKERLLQLSDRNMKNGNVRLIQLNKADGRFYHQVEFVLPHARTDCLPFIYMEN